MSAPRGEPTVRPLVPAGPWSTKASFRGLASVDRKNRSLEKLGWVTPQSSLKTSWSGVIPRRERKPVFFPSSFGVGWRWCRVVGTKRGGVGGGSTLKSSLAWMHTFVESGILVRGAAVLAQFECRLDPLQYPRSQISPPGREVRPPPFPLQKISYKSSLGPVYTIARTRPRGMLNR